MRVETTRVIKVDETDAPYVTHDAEHHILMEIGGGITVVLKADCEAHRAFVAKALELMEISKEEKKDEVV